jgi:hypothetical protein
MTDQTTTEGAQTTTETPGDSGQSTATTTTDGQGATLLTGGDAKPAGDAAGGDGKDTTAADGEAGKTGDQTQAVPEKYDFTMPEGVTLDSALVEKVSPVLRDLKLTNEQANKLASVFAEHRAAETKAAEEAYAQQVTTWADQARTDKDFGGNAFDENVKTAQKAVAAFGSPELKALLNETGYGSHPELLKFCLRVGKAISEDGHVTPAGAGGGARDAAAILFDHPTSNAR